MKHSHLLIIALLFIGCFLDFTSASAQLQGTSALLIGKLTDKAGNPLVSVRFTLNNEGKKIRGKTDAEGTFQQVVKPGATYVIEWQHPNLVLKRDTVAIPNTGKYVEHNATFTPQAISVGDELASGNIFVRGSADFISETELRTLATTLKEYGRLSVNITAGDDIPEPKAKKVKTKPAKKSKKGKIVPEPSVTLSIPTLRKDALLAYFSKNYPELMKRITVTASVIPEANTFTAKVSAIQTALQSDL